MGTRERRAPKDEPDQTAAAAHTPGIPFELRALEEMTDAIVVLDGERRLLYQNEAARRWFRVEDADAIGEALEDAFRFRRSYPGQRAGAARALATGGVWTGEHTFIDSSGLETPVEVTLSRLHDDDAEHSNLLAVMRDLTVRKASEADAAAELAASKSAAAQLAVLKDIAEVASSSLDPRAAAASCVQAVHGLLDTRQIQIRLVNGDGTLLESAAVIDLTGGHLERLGPMPVDADTATAECFRSATARFGEDIGKASVSGASRQNAIDSGVRSLALIPLMVRGKALGTFYAAWGEPRTFSPEDTWFLEAVVAGVAAGLENASLFEAQRSAARSAGSLAAINEMLLSARTTSDVLARLVGEVSMAAGADGCLVIEVRDGSYTPTHARGVKDGLIGVAHDSTFFPGFALAATTRAPVLIGDTFADPRTNKDFVIPWGLPAFQLIPLEADGLVVAVLALAYDAPRTFDASDHEFAARMATAMSLALGNARRYEAEHERARFGDALADVDRYLHASLDFAEITDRALAAGAGPIGAETGAIIGRDGDGWLTWGSYGFTPSVAGVRLTDDQNPHGVFALGSGAVVAVDDAFEDPRVDNAFMKGYGLRSVIVAPLVVRGEAVAGLYYNYTSDKHRFTVEEIDFIAKMASSISLALENARLFEAARRHAELDRFVADAAAALSRTLEPTEAMPDVLTAATGALGADHGMFMTRQPGGWRVDAVHGLPDDILGQFHADDAAPVLQRVLDSAEPVFGSDMEAESEVTRSFAARIGHRAFFACPIRYGERVTAAVVLMFDEIRGPLDEEELDALSRLAFLVGVSEENARLYRREHRIADTLQGALVTLPDRLPGLVYASEYRSATEASRVGGDFYDLFELPDQHVGMTIGDVAGKGLEAAVLTSLVKNSIRAHASERGKSPAQVLSLVNDIVYQATPPEAFATVFFATLDRRDGRLEYASAGHTTTAVVRADGAVTGLPATGPILGAFDAVAFRQAEAALDPDERLFLYTDGLTEARRGKELFGEERLFESLAAAGGSTEAMVAGVTREVLAFCGDDLRDDLAILALRRAPLGSAGPEQLKLET